jgi:hypothetical protein
MHLQIVVQSHNLSSLENLFSNGVYLRSKEVGQFMTGLFFFWEFAPARLNLTVCTRYYFMTPEWRKRRNVCSMMFFLIKTP